MIAGGLAGGWFYLTTIRQVHVLNAARARWETRHFHRYQLQINHDATPLLPMDLAGTYPVTHETLNTRHDGRLQRSVSSYFDWISGHPRSVYFRCNSIRVHCVRALTYDVDVVYDAELGYPRRIELLQIRQPDLLNPRYWKWLVGEDGWRTCENLFCNDTERVVIDIGLIPEE